MAYDDEDLDGAGADALERTEQKFDRRTHRVRKAREKAKAKGAKTRRRVGKKLFEQIQAEHQPASKYGPADVDLVNRVAQDTLKQLSLATASTAQRNFNTVAMSDEDHSTIDPLPRLGQRKTRK